MRKIRIIFIVLLLFLPVLVFAACPENKTCIKNPLEAIEVYSPGDLVVRVIQGFSAIIGTAAVMFTVFSAFKLVIASNEESIKAARESITWSVGGFCVAILSFTIVSGAAKILGIDPGLVDLSEDPSKNIIKSPLSGPADTGNFFSIVNFVMVNILGLLGIVTIFMIIYYGYRYITAAGNEETIEGAKTGLKWAVAGFIVSLLAYTIISSVQRLLLLS